MKPAAPPCARCDYLVAGFRGRRIHIDGQGGIVRGLDHDPEPAEQVASPKPGGAAC